jgi:hypothetical protein
MTIKQILSRLKANHQEDSMLNKFLTWRTKKYKPKCSECKIQGIETEFSNSLCWDCFIKEKQK